MQLLTAILLLAVTTSPSSMPTTTATEAAVTQPAPTDTQPAIIGVQSNSGSASAVVPATTATTATGSQPTIGPAKKDDAANSSMSDLFKIVLTAVVGALLGIFGFVVGQIIQKLFIEPIQEQRKIIGRIAYALTYWVNISELDTPQQIELLEPWQTQRAEKVKEAAHAVRELASDLRASIKTIPWYGLMEKLRFVVSRRDIGLVTYLLIQWYIHMDDHGWIFAASEDIKKRLKITFGNESAAKDIQAWIDKNAFLTKRQV